MHFNDIELNFHDKIGFLRNLILDFHETLYWTLTIHIWILTIQNEIFTTPNWILTIRLIELKIYESILIIHDFHSHAPMYEMTLLPHVLTCNYSLTQFNDLQIIVIYLFIYFWLFLRFIHSLLSVGLTQCMTFVFPFL